jgi:hypothetical protein
MIAVLIFSIFVFLETVWELFCHEFYNPGVNVYENIYDWEYD